MGGKEIRHSWHLAQALKLPFTKHQTENRSPLAKEKSMGFHFSITFPSCSVQMVSFPRSEKEKREKAKGKTHVFNLAE